MKNVRFVFSTILLICFLCSVADAQMSALPDYPKELDQWWPSLVVSQISSPEKITDSFHYQRLNSMGELALNNRQVYLYDSLAQEIRLLDYSYDENNGSQTSLLQTSTIYSDLQNTRTLAKLEGGQWSFVERETKVLRQDAVVLSTLKEIWSAGNNDFVNDSKSTYFYTGNALLPDSILVETWEEANQTWVNKQLTREFYGGDDLRDSSKTLTWDLLANKWTPATIAYNEYNPAGQSTLFRLFQYDENLDSFLLVLNALEYYDANALKDSSHVFTYFGGFYFESLSLFTYENQRLIADTIYSWNEALQQLMLVNYQTYQEDNEGDLVEQKSYAVDLINGGFFQVSQRNFYYSTIDVNTANTWVAPSSISCQMANPYPIHSPILCEWTPSDENWMLRLYDLNGKIQLAQSLPKGSSFQFSIDRSLPPGIYILCLENRQGLFQHYKISILE